MSRYKYKFKYRLGFRIILDTNNFHSEHDGAKKWRIFVNLSEAVDTVSRVK